MPRWVFRGTVLPGGVTGELVAGSGAADLLPGRFALPGLVDAHCHLTMVMGDPWPELDGADLATERLDALARLGVAVVRDVGGERSVTLRIRDQDGRPVVRAAGRFFAPPGRYFPRAHEPVEEAELIAAVLREIDDGASWIKLVADFPVFRDGAPVPGSNAPTYGGDTVAAMIEAAHGRGARVAAHCTTALAAHLVAAGVDSVEHGEGLTAADLDALGRRGGAWTPTIGASVGYDPATRTDDQRARSTHLRDLLPYAVEAGVRVLTGSDVVGSVPQEIAALVDHGLTPTQALTAATTDSQTYLDVPVHDIVTYDQDPREHTEILATPTAVILRNHRVR